MNSTLDTVKIVIMSMIAEVLAFFQPLKDETELLFLVFAMNFFCGYFADRIRNKRGFSFRKAFCCIKEASWFFVLSCSIYMFGTLKGWETSGSIQCVSFLTYVLSWFYSVNILRNSKLFFREESVAHKVLDFLHYMVSIEFVEKIPYLSEYLKHKGNGQEDRKSASA